MPHAALPTTATPVLERGPSNFDFRVVTLLMVLVTRLDLLREYIDDGKEKDDRCVPLALNDTGRWKRLRLLFPPPMLVEMLYLFECRQTQKSILHLRRAFQTMIFHEEYDFNGCPNLDFVKSVVEFSGMITAELDPAGIGSDAESEN